MPLNKSVYSVNIVAILLINSWRLLDMLQPMSAGLTVRSRLSFLCAALLLNEIYPAMKIQVDTSNTFEIRSGQKVWKIKKGNNSKIIMGRVLTLAHNIPLQ
jgi:hypothetical protein